MLLVLALACTVADDTGSEAAPVSCDEGAALLNDVCGAEGVSIDVTAEVDDCESRPTEWQDCWLQCVFDERDQGCDPAMLDCADDCVTE